MNRWHQGLPSEVANDPVALLTQREVQKHKLGHDNIVRIHDLVQIPGENPFISLEYVDGTDLAPSKPINPIICLCGRNQTVCPIVKHCSLPMNANRAS